MNGLYESYTLEINQHPFCACNVNMNHSEEYLMVSLKVVDSKVLRMAINFDIFFLIKRQNGESSV